MGYFKGSATLVIGCLIGSAFLPPLGTAYADSPLFRSFIELLQPLRPPGYVKRAKKRPRATRPETVLPTLRPERPAIAEQSKETDDPTAQASADEQQTLTASGSADASGQYGAADAELQACLTAPQGAGLPFKPVAARADPPGCAELQAIDVARLPAGIALKPSAKINCDMARALAAWSESIVQPAALRNFGQPVSSMVIGASFVCRTQASGTKISEHAFANAIDVTGFNFADGSVYMVGRAAKDTGKQSAFLTEIREKGCAYFNTVLGPGADADHADHLHLDLRGRQGDYRVCQ